MNMGHPRVHETREPGRRPTSGRCAGGALTLLAAMAMILAGPVHLWLAHGHDGSHAESVQQVTGCQHHAHCSSHGHAPEAPQEDDSTPCQDHTGTCETCMALATFVPLQISNDFTVSQRTFLELVYVLQEAPYLDWRGAAIASRGPPAFI